MTASDVDELVDFLLPSVRDEVALAEENERLRAVIEKVRAYARDREFHAKGHLNTVNSGRIASDLFAIVHRPEDDTARPVPEEVAGS